MNRHPIIAGHIVDSVLQVLRQQGVFSPKTEPTVFSSEMREELVRTALQAFSSIPHMESDDPKVIADFLRTHPLVQVLLFDCQRRAQQLWPQAVMKVYITHTSQCTVCYDTRILVLEIQHKGLKTEEHWDWERWCLQHPMRQASFVAIVGT